MGTGTDLKKGKIRQRLRGRNGRRTLFAAAMVSGILNFLGMELVNGDFAQMKFPLGLWNLVLIYGLLFVLFTLTNSLKIGVLCTSALLFLFSLANYFTNLFRGVPLLAPDLLVIRTALSVAGKFTYSIEPAVCVYIGILVLLAGVILWIPEDIRLKGSGRRACWSAVFAVVAVSVYTFGFSDALKNAGVVVSHFNPVRSYAENGSLLTFIRSAQMIRQEKPEGYSPEKTEEIAAAYVKEKGKTTGEYRTPNVIAVMDEAFSDVQSIGKTFETNVDVMPVIHGLRENTLKGTAYTSVFGGYTANSEYEFLTGHSMAGLNGVAPFQFLIKHPLSSLATLLDSREYAGLLAIHPFHKNGYQRPLAYKNLGFSDYRGLEDMDDQEHAYVRDYISDADDMQEVIRSYENIRKTSKAPVFVYTVTMQNHAPYDGEYENFTADVKVLDEELSTPVLENYLSLVKRSDAALGELIDYFKNIDEDTVIVFFGDHEPKLGNSFYKKILGKKVSSLDAEEAMSRYQVPYVIWANYDIEEKNYGSISLNYLGAIMAEATGMELSPFQRYLLDLRKELPIITAQGYWDKDHVFHNADETDTLHEEQLRNYRYIQYNNLTDGRHRVEDFFQ